MAINYKNTIVIILCRAHLPEKDVKTFFPRPIFYIITSYKWGSYQLKKVLKHMFHREDLKKNLK